MQPYTMYVLHLCCVAYEQTYMNRLSSNNRTVQYSTAQYSTVQYSTVQYSTVQYSTVVQGSAVQGKRKPATPPET